MDQQESRSSENIIEYMRKEAITHLFSLKSFSDMWPTWKNEMHKYMPHQTAREIFDLGDHLRDVFKSTTPPDQRAQDKLSISGTCWEAMLCWYLNLCLIGRRTVVIKHNKSIIPDCISNAITVKYGSFTSNTEADLIALTFPDKPEYSMDKDNISIKNSNEEDVVCHKGRQAKYNLSEISNALCERDFNEIEVHIIQCKTNWNDNAQIPMLWSAIYKAKELGDGIKVGSAGYSISGLKNFTYTFVTVPTNKLVLFKSTSTCVQRVNNLSGGHYWGTCSKNGVASSVKEMLDDYLKSGNPSSHIDTIKKSLPELKSTYSYFNLL